MKKVFFKSCTLIIAAVILGITSVFSGSALTLYESDGYTFAGDDSGFISLFSWDNHSPELIVPDSFQNMYVTSVYEYAFKDNEVISTLDFSNTNHINSIGMRAFSGCSSISNDLVLPATLSSIGMCAFQDCSSLPSVSIGGSVSEIPSQCFYNCTSLKTVYLPINLKSIDRLAFANCPRLRDVYLNTAVESINSSAFKNSDFVRLNVYYDSYAYHYAKDNNIEYKLLDGVKLGDVNGDGIVNVDDATLIQKYLAELETIEGIYLYAADSNEDQMYSVELQTGHPIGQVLTK